MLTKSRFNEQCITFSQMNLIYNSRIFLRRFTTWVREYLVSRYTGTGTAEESFGRLYLEAADFGDMLRIVFGREIANRFAQLLNQYIFGLRDLISAHIEGNTEGVNQNLERLYQDLENITAFLVSINPYFDEAEWKGLPEEYLRSTIEQANSFILGDHSKDIAEFESLTVLTDKMGDILAQSLYDYMTSGLQTADDLSDVRCITYEQMNDIFSIRMFWFEIFIWVRAYMLSRYAGIGNVEEVYARLRQVPVDYIKKSQLIYGEIITPVLQMVNILTDLVDALITANIEDNVDEIDRITQLIYQYADEGSAFLASQLPYWDQDEWRSRLNNILQNIINESRTYLTKEYARNLDIFSILLDQAENASGYIAQYLFDLLSSQNKNS